MTTSNLSVFSCRCGQTYPADRAQCPYCRAPAPVVWYRHGNALRSGILEKTAEGIDVLAEGKRVDRAVGNLARALDAIRGLDAVEKWVGSKTSLWTVLRVCGTGIIAVVVVLAAFVVGLVFYIRGGDEWWLILAILSGFGLIGGIGGLVAELTQVLKPGPKRVLEWRFWLRGNDPGWP